jgi:ribosomal protein S17E
MGKGRERIIAKTRDELIELVTSELTDEFSEGKKLEQICLELGLHDTVNLIDERTSQLMELYEGYKNASHLIDKKIFLETVVILNQYQPRIM